MVLPIYSIASKIFIRSGTLLSLSYTFCVSLYDSAAIDQALRRFPCFHRGMRIAHQMLSLIHI